MKAAVCYEYNAPLVIEEVELDPALPKKGQVKVRIAATAICHSDIGEIKGELFFSVPFVPGHESAGYISEVGEGVTTVKKGDPVVIAGGGGCGTCYNCRTGLPMLCTGRSGLGPASNFVFRNKSGKALTPQGGIGGFAEYILFDETQVLKLPQDMPLDSAALITCAVITGYGAVVNRMKVPALRSVVVIGVGGVGIGSIQAAALSGAYPVIAVDVVDSKLETAKKFGATHGVNAKSENAVDAVKELTAIRGGADYVFVTVGSVAAIKQGVAMCGTRGSTVIVGLPPKEETITFSHLDFMGGEKVLTGSVGGSGIREIDISDLIMLYQTGRLKLDEMITARYPLEQINEAIKSTESGEALRNVIMF
jgi:S-(hydroxymethyl)glutathione dehydrogenase/alcohol dehydrogenase